MNKQKSLLKENTYFSVIYIYKKSGIQGIHQIIFFRNQDTIYDLVN